MACHLQRRQTARAFASVTMQPEHVMIVDLERNDLGRICKTGTVHVESMNWLFPTCPSDLVSTVAGELRDSVGLPEILRATFPGGSITALQMRHGNIISEVERERRRHLYAPSGSAGPCTGESHFSIAIRHG